MATRTPPMTDNANPQIVKYSDGQRWLAIRFHCRTMVSAISDGAGSRMLRIFNQRTATSQTRRIRKEISTGQNRSRAWRFILVNMAGLDRRSQLSRVMVEVFFL